MGMLRAAAGQTDLDPPVGSWLSGFAARTAPSTGLHDPIMARAVLLEGDGGALALVSCDLIGLTTGTAAQLRERIAAACDGSIEAGHVLIACTHTHSGPASMPLRGVMGHVDGAWLRAAMRRIVELVTGLRRLLQPARLACASRMVPGIGFNRQDGSRAIDERLGVLGVDAGEGRPIATIVNYATHAVVLGPDNLRISADYPGELARCLTQRRGGIGVFLQGACGDVDPVIYRDRGWGTGTFEDARQIGERLADEVVAALTGTTWSTEPGMHVARETLAVPLDPLPSEEELRRSIAGFEADRRRAREEPGGRSEELIAEAMLDWAAEVREASRSAPVPRTIPAELFMASVGDARIIGVPFETYSGIAVAVREAIRPRIALFAGYANGLYGYCPTRWAKEQGGYGPEGSSRWFPQLVAPIGYGADELIIEHAAALAGR